MREELRPLDRLLLRLLRGPEAEFVVGDLVERFCDDRRSGVDVRRARARLRRGALRSLAAWIAPAGVRERRRRRVGMNGRRGEDHYARVGEFGKGGTGMWGTGTGFEELRFALRSVVRRPGFSLGVALTLGLGIGATTTIFSVVDGVLLRPLAFEDPESLVAVGTTFPGREWVEGRDDLQHLAGTSLLNFRDLEERSRSFQRLGAVELQSILLTDIGDGPEIAPSAAVTPGFFEILGVGPELGRDFMPGDFEFGGPAVFLISHGAFERRFGADPSIVGRPLDRAGAPATVIGVLPRDFDPPEALFTSVPDFWAPLPPDHPRYESRGRRSLSIVGRLSAGVSVEDARAEATAIADQLAVDFPEGNVYPDGSWFGLGVNGLHDHTVGGTGRTLWIFLGASLLLLFLAALNAATLMLARSLDRVRELGVRVALGAGRARVVRLLVAEAGVLTALGAAIGIGMAYGGVAAFVHYAPTSIPRTSDVSVDTRVLLVALVIAGIVGVAAGLAPAVATASTTPWRRLQSAARTTADGQARLRTVLVGGQVALAVVLLSGAGLLLTSFVNIRSVEPGFVPDGLLSLNVPLKRPGAPEGEQDWQAWNLALDHLRSVPGVVAVAGTSNPPFQSPFSAPRILLPRDAPDTWREGIAGYSITPGYLETVGTRLLSGRDISGLDRSNTENVALVNEEFRRSQLDGAEPIGVSFEMVEGDTRVPFRIVGVVQDVVQGRAEEGPRAAVYFPHTQVGWPFVQAVVRSDLPPAVLVPELRRALARFNPYVPPRDVRTLSARMADSRTSPRFQVMLFGAFALIALSLAAAGLYGSLSHAVGRRRREMGVRMALGADRAGVLWMILWQGLRVSAVGLVVGILAALGGTRVLAGFLYGVQPGDARTLLAVSVALLAVAAVACLLPARRATGVDPVTVLRSD